MKKQYFSPIQNPMTIIALFVGLTEIGFGGTLVLSKLSENLQYILIIFLVSFPSVCLICFFCVLLFRPKNFYGPNDFRSDDSYLTLNRQIADIKASTQSITDEQSNKQKLPTEDTIAALVNHLDQSTCWYILRVVNKAMSFDEHIFVMAQVLSEVIGEGSDDVLEDSHLSLVALGHTRCIWANFNNVLFYIKNTDGKYQLDASNIILSHLGQKLGGFQS